MDVVLTYHDLHVKIKNDDPCESSSVR